MRNQKAERFQRQPQSQPRFQQPAQAHAPRQSMPQRAYGDPMAQPQQPMRQRMPPQMQQPMYQQYAQPQRQQYYPQQQRQPNNPSPRPHFNEGRQIVVNSTPPAFFNRQNFLSQQNLQNFAQTAQRMMQGQARRNDQVRQHEPRRQPRQFDNRQPRHNTRQAFVPRQEAQELRRPNKHVPRRSHQQTERNNRQNQLYSERRWQKRERSRELEEEDVQQDQQEEEEEEQDEEEEEQQYDQQDQEDEQQQQEEPQDQAQDEPEEQAQDELPASPQPQKRIEYKPITAQRQPSKNIDDEPSALQKCAQMCPLKQFNDRLKNFEDSNTMGGGLKLDTQSSFSLFEINKKTNRPDIKLTLKRFKRAANNEQGENTVVRTPAALVESMEHILKYIMDSDSMPSNTLPFIKPVDKNNITFKEIYDFLWNRTRAMIKEISQLSPNEQRSAKIVTMSQQIARFLILSINEMREFEQFDEQMNKKSIEKILTQLLQTYRYGKEEVKRLLLDLKKKGIRLQTEEIFEEMKNKKIYISPCEPEISSYALVFTEIKNVYQHLGNISQSLKELRVSPLMQSKDIKIALEMVDAVNMKNIAKFFKLIEDDNTSYLLACTLLFHVHDIRKDTLTRIIKTSRQMTTDGQVNKQSLPFKMLNNLLYFNGNDEAMIRFLNHVGATVFEDSIAKSALSEADGLHYTSPYFDFPKNKFGREESREKIIRATWRTEPEYSRLVVEALKKFYWQQYEEEPNLSINEEPSSEARRVEAPAFTSTEEDRIALRQKIKKNRRLKMLQNVKNKTLEVWRRLFSRKKNQLEVLTRLFEILSSKMDKHEAVGFKKLRAFGEYIVDLRTNFQIIKKATKQRAFLRNQIQQINPFTLYNKDHFNRRFLDKLDDVGLNERVRNAARRRREGYGQNQQEIAPSFQELDIFQEKSRAQGFYSVICQSLLESEHAKEDPTPTFRILIPIDEQSLDHKAYSGNLTMLVAYLTRLQGIEQFYEFLCSDELRFTFIKYLQFDSQIDGSVVNFCIQYVLDFCKYDGQQNIHTVLDQNLYGALAVIYPYLKGAAQQNAFQNALNLIDEALQKIPYVVYKVCENKHETTENSLNLQVAVEYIADVTVSQRSRAIIESALRKAMQARRATHEIRCVGIYELLGQINVNLQYLYSRVKQNSVKFIFFQEYFNYCINQLLEAAKNIFKHRHLCSDWPFLIKECCENQDASYKDISQRQSTFLQGFFGCLKMDLLKAQYFQITNKIDQISKNVMRYLVVACNSKEIIKSIKESGLAATLQQKCRINACQLPDGAILEVFSTIIGQITLFYKNFERCQVILPSNFKFNIKFQELQNNVSTKCSNIFKGIRQRQTKKEIKNEKLRQRFRESKQRLESVVLESSFQYVRQKELDEYLRRVNNTRDSTAGELSFTL